MHSSAGGLEIFVDMIREKFDYIDQCICGCNSMLIACQVQVVMTLIKQTCSVDPRVASAVKR